MSQLDENLNNYTFLNNKTFSNLFNNSGSNMEEVSTMLYLLNFIDLKNGEKSSNIDYNNLTIDLLSKLKMFTECCVKYTVFNSAISIIYQHFYKLIKDYLDEVIKNTEFTSKRVEPLGQDQEQEGGGITIKNIFILFSFYYTFFNSIANSENETNIRQVSIQSNTNLFKKIDIKNLNPIPDENIENIPNYFDINKQMDKFNKNINYFLRVLSISPDALTVVETEIDFINDVFNKMETDLNTQCERITNISIDKDLIKPINKLIEEKFEKEIENQKEIINNDSNAENINNLNYDDKLISNLIEENKNLSEKINATAYEKEISKNTIGTNIGSALIGFNDLFYSVGSTISQVVEDATNVIEKGLFLSEEEKEQIYKNEIQLDKIAANNETIQGIENNQYQENQLIDINSQAQLKATETVIKDILKAQENYFSQNELGTLGILACAKPLGSTVLELKMNDQDKYFLEINTNYVDVNHLLGMLNNIKFNIDEYAKTNPDILSDNGTIQDIYERVKIFQQLLKKTLYLGYSINNKLPLLDIFNNIKMQQGQLEKLINLISSFLPTTNILTKETIELEKNQTEILSQRRKTQAENNLKSWASLSEVTNSQINGVTNLVYDAATNITDTTGNAILKVAKQTGGIIFDFSHFVLGNSYVIAAEIAGLFLIFILLFVFYRRARTGAYDYKPVMNDGNKQTIENTVATANTNTNEMVATNTNENVFTNTYVSPSAKWTRTMPSGEIRRTRFHENGGKKTKKTKSKHLKKTNKNKTKKQKTIKKRKIKKKMKKTYKKKTKN
jgi:hypothetical protein